MEEKGMVLARPSGNPLVQLQDRFKELESGFKAWLAKQSIPVEAAVVTATSAAQGAFMGALMGTLTGDLPTAMPPAPPPGAGGLSPEAMASFKQAQAFTGGPMVQARNFAVMTGVNAGISCVMKRVRGVDDVQNSMVAAFGSGAMYSLISGMGAPNQAIGAVTSGLFFALIQGGIYQVGQKFSAGQGVVEDLSYSQTTNMLNGLGLEKYSKNFKRGMLTDKTLPLLTDSALRDVKIPPGPRLLILDYIGRNPELAKGSR